MRERQFKTLLLLAILAAGTVLSANATAKYSGGYGWEGSSYLIRSAADWKTLAASEKIADPISLPHSTSSKTKEEDDFYAQPKCDIQFEVKATDIEGNEVYVTTVKDVAEVEHPISGICMDGSHIFIHVKDISEYEYCAPCNDPVQCPEGYRNGPPIDITSVKLLYLSDSTEPFYPNLGRVVGVEYVGSRGVRFEYEAPKSFWTPEGPIFDELPVCPLAKTNNPLNNTPAYIPLGGYEYQESVIRLKMVSAPVLLLHGLNSKAGIWEDLVKTLGNFSVTTFCTYPGEGGPRTVDVKPFPFVHAHDYSSTSLSSFETNIPVVKDGINEALNKAKQRGFVASKVDIVAHSMGGILVRGSNLRPSIRRFITLDTPHFGSQLANFFGSINLTWLETEMIEILAGPPSSDAWRDLRVGSNALTAINNCVLSVPTHVIVGHSNSESSSRYKGLAYFIERISFFSCLAN